MIEPTSGSQVAKALGDRLSGPEAQAKAAAVEKASKVGSRQHQEAMNFLADKMGKSLDANQASAASVEVTNEETKKETKKQNAARNDTSKLDASLSSTTDPSATTPPVVDPADPDLPGKPTLLPMEPPVPPPPVTPPGFALGSVGAKERESHNAALTRIMMQMSEALSDDALEKVESQRVFQASASKLSMESIQKTEEEQIEKQRKADQAQEISSCVLQVVTAIVAVAMLIYSVVTMNPLLIVMAVVGLAMVAADTVLAALGETTLSEMIFGPLMEHVIMPMAEFFGSIFEDIFLAFGADAEAAKIAGLVMGLITVFAIIIAMVVGAKNSTLLSSALSKMGSMMGSVIGKMTPEIVKGMARSASTKLGGMVTGAATRMNFSGSATAGRQAFARAMAAGDTTAEAAIKASTASAAAIARGAQMTAANMQILMQGSSLVGGVAGGSAGIAAATFQYDVAQLRERLAGILGDITSRGEMSRGMQDYFSDMMQTSTELMENALDAEATTQQAAKEILSKMSKGM